MPGMRIQPQGRCQIDWASPIVSGLRFAYNGATAGKSLFGPNVAVNGAVNKVSGKFGLYHSFNGSNQSLSVPLNLSNTKGVTVVTLVDISGVTSQQQNLFEFGTDTIANSQGFDFYFNSSDIQIWCGNNGNSRDGNRYAAPTVGPRVYVTTYDHTQTSGNQINLYQNGMIQARTETIRAEGGNNGFFTSDTLYIGSRVNNNYFLNGAISLQLVFDRVLSPSEITSISNNPWQIFVQDAQADYEDYLTLLYTNTSGSSTGASSASVMTNSVILSSGSSSGTGSAFSVTQAVVNSYGTSISASSVNANAFSITYTTASSSSNSSADVKTQAVWNVNGTSQGSASLIGDSASVWQIVGTSEGFSQTRGRSIADAGKNTYADVIATSFGSSSAYVVTQTVFEAVGNSFGSSRAVSTSQTLTSAIAQALGTSSADGKGVAVITVTGKSISESFAQSKANSVFGVTGSSQAIAVVSAATVIVYESVAKVVSASSAQAVIQSVARTFGNSVGKSVVSGITEGGAHYTAYGDKFNVTIVFAPYSVEVNSSPYTIKFN